MLQCLYASVWATDDTLAHLDARVAAGSAA
jgi:hypothetical protein